MANAAYSIEILNLCTENYEDGIYDEQETKQIVKDLRLSMLKLMSKNLNEIDGSLDYRFLPHSQEFIEFEKLSQGLVSCNPAVLRVQEKKTFFINLYNVLTLHALAIYHRSLSGNLRINSTLDIPFFWRKYAYKIGPYTLSLDDIEHGILRANREHPTTKEQMFDTDDPRIKLSLPSVDPRIHFALNCGAKSCPAIAVYSSDTLDDRLNAVTRAYLEQEVSVEKSGVGEVLILPQILEWYGGDFAKDLQGILRWLLRYTEGAVHELMKSLIEKETETEGKIKFVYDWSLKQTTRL